MTLKKPTNKRKHPTIIKSEYRVVVDLYARSSNNSNVKKNISKSAMRSPSVQVQSA